MIVEKVQDAMNIETFDQDSCEYRLIDLVLAYFVDGMEAAGQVQ
jgi:hypothetical protein